MTNVSIHFRIVLLVTTTTLLFLNGFMATPTAEARQLSRNGHNEEEEQASSALKTCELLKCCDDTNTKTITMEIDSSKDYGYSNPSPLPPPVPDGGPYPVRQKAILPGLVDNDMKHEYYSGFLDAGVPPSGLGTMYLHYICAMAPGNWTDQPMILWYNGGPGAPSTFGLFQEFGPYLLTSQSLQTKSYQTTGIPTPVYNPWTWANHASICEIDSPAPMGASFCTEGNGTSTNSSGGPSGDPYSCGPWTDHSVAVANHRAYQSLFQKAFPEFEFSQQPVSIVGESYAGVYVPLFVEQWLEDPITGPNGTPIHFAGFAVGDGFPACIPPSSPYDDNVKKPVDWCANLTNVGFFQYPNALPGPFWDIEFFHGHSQMSEALYMEIKSTCIMEELKGIVMPLSEQCQSIIDKMTDEVGLFHVYNLLEACPPGPTINDSGDELLGYLNQQTNDVASSIAHPRRMFAGNAHKRMPSTHRRRHLVPPSSPGDGDTGLGAPCLGNSMDIYFDLDVVKQGLGIPLDNNFIVLDNGIGFNYTTTASFVGPIYDQAIDAGLRVLVYEGDTDACGLQTAPIESVWVPYFGDGYGEWTPMGRLEGQSGKPLGLPMTGPGDHFRCYQDQKVVSKAGTSLNGGKDKSVLYRYVELDILLHCTVPPQVTP